MNTCTKYPSWKLLRHPAMSGLRPSRRPECLGMNSLSDVFGLKVCGGRFSPRPSWRPCMAALYPCITFVAVLHALVGKLSQPSDQSDLKGPTIAWPSVTCAQPSILTAAPLSALVLYCIAATFVFRFWYLNH